MTDAPAARVFTIPPGVPFLATLADTLLNGTLVPGFPDAKDPLSLASATILLPTRRAARALIALLAERSGEASLILPKIVPLGDIDSDGLELHGETGVFDTPAEAILPPAIGETERRLVLTELVLAWARSVDRAILRLGPEEPLLVPASPADALALAGDLARFMDALATEDIAWERLRGLVEERYDRYFAITLEFLKIAAETWPAILAERDAMDPASRRNALLSAEAARLERERPAAPMIAAGSTGSIPATARLIAAIARLPNGAVVLPGLDRDLDADSWRAITEAGPQGDAPAHGHAQAALARLLRVIGVARDAVSELRPAPPAAAARARFLGEALRPAATTEQWASTAERLDAAALARALDGLALVEAADEREEALAAALAIREALETPGATVALVTPDRGLAGRVGVELKRWTIEVEDSAGAPLAGTLIGRLARLVAEAAASDLAARQLLALLAHPLATFGWPRATSERAAAALEIGLLRGPEPPAGIAGLRAILPERRGEARGPHAARPLTRLTNEDWRLVAALLDRLAEAFAGFAPAKNGAIDLVTLAGHHRHALKRVAGPVDGDADSLFGDDPGEALAALFDDIALAENASIGGRLADYPTFFAGLAGERVVRGGKSGHRRVRIWGLLEARLLQADRLVLGGLDEGVWPPATRTDAFLNRPMRAALGLTPPERRIGQTAHDFVAALGTRDVVITRAWKREGAPTVPSRFLQRMRAVVGKDAWQTVLDAGQRYLALGRALDRPDRRSGLARPAPKPPLDLVPRALSVTEIETLVRDPYSIFARHVLKLDALDDVAIPPGAADRGSIIHDVLGKFAQRHPGELPADAADILLDLGREAFAAVAAYPDIAARWWPRFVRLTGAFMRWERERRPRLDAMHAEVAGSLPLALADAQVFTLRARADRIERFEDGSRVVVDFKTGAPPTAKMVFAGFSPQLTLEAAMLKRGAFTGAPASDGPIELLYVHATGGLPPLKPCPIDPPKGDTRTVTVAIEEHLAKLEALMTRYLSGESGFMARPFPQYAKRFNAYDHLARVGEWSAGVEVDAEGA